jgi:YD repeat-containing protein
LISLPARGLDLGLTLSYNSLVWTRSGNSMNFDLDQGSIAPGFRLGFPIVEGPYWNSQAGANFYLLITPSGARLELRQVGSSLIYESADSSHLRLTDNTSADFSLLLQPTDGSKLRFEPAGGGWRCKKITDRNGNFITATYKSWGELETVTDTLGRVLTFNYDSNDNLQSITQTWIGQTHEWATFGWGTAAIGNNFPGMTNLGPNSTSIPVLTQVGLADGSRYTFGYTTQGLVSNISRAASDTYNPSYTIYEYDSSDDCPRITQKRVWATNWSDQEGVPHEVATSFGHDADGGCRLTLPDGTIYKEFYGNGWQSGLPTETRNYATVADANANVWQKKTTTTWTQDNTGVGYITNPRVTETNIYDASGNRRRTTVDYGAYAQHGLPYIVKEYAGDGATELRRSQTDYNLSQVYLDRRIIGLVSASQLYDAVAGQWQAKVTYTYDGSAINSQATAATQHDQTFSASFTTRGNVTSVSRWDVTDIDNSSKKLTSSATYDAAGSVIGSSDPAGHASSIGYVDSFSDSINRNTYAYPTSFTDADGFSSTVQYKFEFGAKMRVQTPLPNVTTNQPGPVTTFAYDAAGRIQQSTQNNGAYTRYIYGPDYVETLSSVNNLADEAYTFQLFNGRGQVFISGGNHPGSNSGYRAQTTYYDVMGRVMKQSNPTEINGSWIPSGDDVYNAQTDTGGWRFTQQSYDWKGRVRITTNTDGTYKEASYSGCGCAGGEVVTLTDEVNRQQRIYSDVLGRTWKTEILNWNGSVYSSTTSSLNARDQATLVRQFAGTDQSQTYQDTTMSYDGYGRLQTKHVPEQNAGTATVYAYNLDDTIQSVTDARGAMASYSYVGNNRHLVTGITYSAPSAIPIPAAASFGYDSAGNRTSMADGTGSLTYQYNSLSQLTSETRQFNGAGAPSTSYTLSYQYNLAGALKKITDPTNVTINYNHDTAGRVIGVTGENNLVNGVSQYASNFAYRAWGAVKNKDYASGGHSHVDYNARLLPTTTALSNLYPGSIPNGTMTWNYEYYADGRIQLASDSADNRFDRLQEYDHAGRLKEAYSGREARGLAQTTPADNPYRQSMQYDAWDNMTSKSGRFWRQSLSDSGTYINNRRQYWSYDAEGNAGGDGKSHSYDAAGKQIMVTSGTETVGGSGTGHPVQSGWEIAQTYDVEGKPVKRLETRRSEEYIGEGPQTNITETVTTTYYLYSSVLGAKVVELDASGVKTKGYVYANGERLAKQEINQWWSAVWWHHSNAGTNSWVEANEGVALRQEMDPMGAEVGTSDPYLDLANPTYKDIQTLPQQLYLEGGDPFDYSGGYEIDGMPVSASEFMRRVGGGSVTAGRIDRHGNTFQANEMQVFGSSVWVDRWDTTNSSDIDHDISTPYIVNIVSQNHGYFLTANDGLTMRNSVARRPQNLASQTGRTQQKPIWCQRDVITAMNDAWSRSGNAGMSNRVGSGGVEAGFNLNGAPTSYQIDPKFTNEQNKMTIKYNPLGYPPAKPMPTFANFHVHPRGRDANNGAPSTPGNNSEANGRGDTGAFDDIYNNPKGGKQAIQVFVMSWYGLSMYDPATRQTTQLVSGIGFLKGKDCPP